MRTLIGSIGILLLLGVVTGVSQAKTGFFAYGGGSTIQTNREELDDFLNPIENVDWRTGWEAGMGARFFGTDDGPGSPITGDSRWALRLRVGYMAGELEDSRVSFSRTSSPVYTSTVVETFEYEGWKVGATVVARVLPMLAFTAGPGIETVKFRAEYSRDWEGEIPGWTGPWGDAQAEGDARAIYGFFEVGTRLTPIPRPVGLEIYWTPRRVQMSSSQQIQTGEYEANFAELTSAWGLRLSYDF